MTDRLIYAALVAVWMAYLVPMGIRRYREVAARGSIASFSSSMVALAGDPVRVAPGGTPPGTAVSAHGASGATVAARPGTAGVLDRPAARRAAARRRRILIVLVGLVAVTGVLVVLTTLLWPAVLLPVALVVAFLIVSRVQVARQEHAAWARAAKARTGQVAPPAPAHSRIDISGDAADDDETVVIHGDAAGDLAGRLARPVGATAYSPSSSSAAPVEAHGAHPAGPADRRPAANGAHAAVALHAASAADATPGADGPDSPAEQPTGTSGVAQPAAAPAAPVTWDPRPVTLPTYITKSRAIRPVRGVDRTGSSTWSSSRVQGDQQVRGERADQPAQHRRAVGG